jgi:hypothetical protein
MSFVAPKFKLGLLAFFDIEVNPNPAYERSIAGSQRFGSAQEPPVYPFLVTSSEGYLARASSAKTSRPDPASLFVIIGV